jgi:hypothetical protein
MVNIFWTAFFLSRLSKICSISIQIEMPMSRLCHPRTTLGEWPVTSIPLKCMQVDKIVNIIVLDPMQLAPCSYNNKPLRHLGHCDEQLWWRDQNDGFFELESIFHNRKSTVLILSLYMRWIVVWQCSTDETCWHWSAFAPFIIFIMWQKLM